CAGSIVAAVAPSTSILIAGRVVMGLGRAASQPGPPSPLRPIPPQSREPATLSLFRHIYPERRERARALGVWAAVSGLALALGPIIGGVLAAGIGWGSTLLVWLALLALR